MSVNICQFIGRVAQDPKVENLKEGQKVARFSLAIETKWKDKYGHKQSSLEFVDFVAWNVYAEIVRKFVRKGVKMWVTGRLKTDKWTDDKGANRRSTKIVVERIEFLDSARKPGESADEAVPEETEAEEVDPQY